MRAAVFPVVLMVFSPLMALAGEARVSLVRVHKAERRLELLAGDTILRSYPIALGDAPVGHKTRQGDEKTPEGRYVLDWRNSRSGYYRSIHISYPDRDDRARAAQHGVDPGGDIMIHGQPNGFSWLAPVLQAMDWTNGCIAVTNEHMAEIWSMVENGTPIEINP